MNELNFISPYVRHATCVRNPPKAPGYTPTWLSNETENLLIYVISGSFLHTIDGRCTEVQEGMIEIIPPYANQVIGEVTSGQTDIYCVYFDLFDCEESRSTLHRSRDRHLPKREMYFTGRHTLTLIEESRRPQLLKMLEYITANFDSSSEPEMLTVKGYMLLILAEFLSSPPLDEYEKRSSASLYVSETLRYVDHNYADITLSVAGIASHLGISIAYLSRLFKKEYGQNLYDYITNVRISRAKDLFALGRRISEVAEQCGFLSLQAFSRTFRRIEGISPREYIARSNAVSDEQQ